jgi:hypothetical protein
MTAYLVLFAIVFGVNLLPAFGPPTWSIIVVYGLATKLNLPVMIGLSAVAAASGRLLLASAFRLLRHRIPGRMKRNLEAAGRALEAKRSRSALGMGLFALSPLPSAQLFEAAGLANMRLLPLTAAFLAGRLVSYSVYAFSAKGIAEKSGHGESIRHALTSPVGIALQLGMIALLVLLAQVDWAKHLGTGKARKGKGK